MFAPRNFVGAEISCIDFVMLKCESAIYTEFDVLPKFTIAAHRRGNCVVTVEIAALSAI